MFPVVMGAVAGSAISSAASGAMQYYQWKQDRDRRRKERKEEIRRQSLAYRMAEARAAGIHPLAALGVAQGPIPSAVVGDYGQWESFGQAAGKLTEMAFSGRQKDMENLAFLQEYERWEIMQLQKKILSNEVNSALGGSLGDPELDQLNRMGQGANARANFVQMQGDVQTMRRGPGFTSGVHATMSWGVLPNPKGDRYVPALTQKFTESMEEDLGFKIPKYVNDISNYFQGWEHAFTQTVSKDKSKAYLAWLDYWKKYLPNEDLKPGHYWHYSVAGGYFYQSRKRPGAARDWSLSDRSILKQFHDKRLKYLRTIDQPF